MSSWKGKKVDSVKNLIYVDLDDTLIHAEADPETRVVGRIIVRPGASAFIRRLGQMGTVVLLTHAPRDHAMRGLKAIGSASEVFVNVISREDLQPVIDQIEAINSTPKLREKDKIRLYREVLPIAPPGFMIDDWPVGSWMYWLKSCALGIGRNQWIQVIPFDPYKTNGAALNYAYYELYKRVAKQPALEA